MPGENPLEKRREGDVKANAKGLQIAGPEVRRLPPLLEELGPEQHGVVLADSNQIITHCNSEFVKLTGYDYSDVIGKNCRILQGKETDIKTVDYIRAALKRGEGCQVMILNYRKCGSPFWNRLSIQPLLDHRGKITQFVGIQIAKPVNTFSRFEPLMPWVNQTQQQPPLLTTGPSTEKDTDDEFDVLVEKNAKQSGPVDDVAHDVSFVAETLLPTNKGKYRVRAYKDNVTKQEIMCIISGKIEGSEGLHVRCHDQCFTSEVLWSLKCDCKQQLDYAMDHIRERKAGGMIIYLPQEGRGMGLAHKIKAYSVQEHGYDTVDANLVLGFPDDSRTYGCVPGILQEMNIKSIRLMTNNPRKMAHLKALGVKVDGRVPVITPSNKFSTNYLQTKNRRQGHMDIGKDIYCQETDKEEGEKVVR
uniref:GTP cyclohydrolase II n=1 Tax=Lotharella oceanica TaxID=641309 RepID=A0A7S2U248_9EUKA